LRFAYGFQFGPVKAANVLRLRPDSTIEIVSIARISVKRYHLVLVGA